MTSWVPFANEDLQIEVVASSGQMQPFSLRRVTEPSVRADKHPAVP